LYSGADRAPIRLKAGDTFAARWSGKRITVLHPLGEGANGSVYLAHFPGGPAHCALKIGNDAYALQSEVNALRSIGAGAPTLLLADDVEACGTAFPFYIMSFVPGATLAKLTKPARSTRPGSGSAPSKLSASSAPGIASGGNARGIALDVVGRKLLERLRELHEAGWAFGDLKSDNVMISVEGDVRLVDFGGATRFGRAVKQYTELYDRGFWKAGGRKAEPAYDLFAFAVVMLEAAGFGGRLRAASTVPGARGRAALLRLADECAALAPAKRVLARLLRAEYANAADAQRDWTQAWSRADAGDASSADAAGAAGAASRPDGRPAEPRWPAIWFAGAALSCAAVVWWMQAS